MMSLRHWPAVLVLALLPAVRAAAPPLDLAGAERELLAGHPRALAAAEELARARSAAWAGWSGLLPRADLSSNWTRYEAVPAGGVWREDDETQRHVLALSQPLFAGGRLAAGAAAGSAGLKAARERHRAALAQLVYDLRAAWVDWLAARELLQIAQAGEEFAQRQLQRALQQEEQGVASRIDRLFIENSLALAGLQREDALTTELTARLRLEALLRTELSSEAELEDLARLLAGLGAPPAEAGEASPELASLRWDMRQAAWQGVATAGSLWPTLSAGLTWSNEGSDPFTYDSRHTTRTVGLSLSWNIFRGGANSLASLGALATARRARHLLDAGELGLHVEQETLGRQEEAQRRKLELAERSRAISRENLGLLEQKYGLGMVPVTDLLQGEQNLRGAHGGLVQAQSALLKAHWSRERLAGRW
ncbi:MAG: TolC family protein [bacterium]|jgi:outer membrane protein|nr:TolC family protein [bacterium]